MKEVKRFKCDYCNKLAVRAETIERHEEECLKNPNTKNCYMCKHSVCGGYRDLPYGMGEKWDEELPYCAYHLTPLEDLRFQGYDAKTCSDYEKADGMYYTRRVSEEELADLY